MARAQGGPAYPVPWIATYFFAAAVLIAGSFVIAWYLDQPKSEYDYDNQDMRFLEAIILSPDPREGDFTSLNGGDWKVLCLVGWNADVRAALATAVIPDHLSNGILTQVTQAKDDLKKTQFFLVYTDQAGTVTLVRHPHGFAFAHDRAAHCTTKSRPRLALPIRP